ncbi:MAG: hypothetical protein K1X57_13915 [Gemmataceae bacterium]|nr:hypothetical protein [Gemmataceae bacterium]
MLIISLIVSLVFLSLMGQLATNRRYRMKVVVGLTLVMVAIQTIVFDLPPWPFVVLGIGILILTGVCQHHSRPTWQYGIGLCAVSGLAYYILYHTAIRPNQLEYARLRELYPLQDISQRVRPPASPVAQFASPTYTDEIDFLDSQGPERENLSRKLKLHTLHERSVTLFINSPGLGESRLVYLPSAALLESPEVHPVSQPGPRVSSAGDEFPEIPRTSDGFRKLLRLNYLDFANADGWGYMNSRKQVAGFVPHQMRWSPKGADDWSLQTLDLVGLLMHDKPVAYVSEKLPRMDQLKTAPTRDLDPFEAAGLTALKAGEDLYARQNATTLRMLGAIRAVEQCTTCHACDRGELLGAFSYTLGRAKP